MVAALRAQHEATLARIGPAKAWENIVRGLVPQLHSNDERAEADAAWDRWNEEHGACMQAKLQMELGERVAGTHGRPRRANQCPYSGANIRTSIS